MICHHGIGELVLQRISVFDIPYGAGRLRGEIGHAFIAFTPNARGPFDRSVAAHLVHPILAYFRQVIREQKRRARTVGTMDHGNVLIGKLQALVYFDNCRIVPFFDGSEVDVREDLSGQFEFAFLYSGDIDDGNNPSHDHRPLHEPVFLEFLFLKGHVGSSEIHGVRLDLLDAAAGAD